jgi:hypothetical protein
MCALFAEAKVWAAGGGERAIELQKAGPAVQAAVIE